LQDNKNKNILLNIILNDACIPDTRHGLHGPKIDEISLTPLHTAVLTFPGIIHMQIGVKIPVGMA